MWWVWIELNVPFYWIRRELLIKFSAKLPLITFKCFIFESSANPRHLKPKKGQFTSRNWLHARNTKKGHENTFLAVEKRNINKIILWPSYCKNWNLMWCDVMHSNVTFTRHTWQWIALYESTISGTYPIAQKTMREKSQNRGDCYKWNRWFWLLCVEISTLRQNSTHKNEKKVTLKWQNFS